MTNFIIIDGSYYCFYRYFALERWWSFAKPDEEIGIPLENKEFLEKFKSTFISKIKEIENKLKIKNAIKIVAKDCPREKIWRNKLCNNYKGNRTSDDNFMGGPFFKIAHQELWEKAGIKTIISYPELEADDCIALTVERIKETYPEANVYIIANDMDYLQLASEKIFIYNLKYKNLSDSKYSTKNAECDKFCKIICGDKSDNIPGIFKKCGIKTAIKYYNDQELFNSKLKENIEYEKQFLLNKKLIDFNEIPVNLKNGFKKDVLLI